MQYCLQGLYSCMYEWVFDQQTCCILVQCRMQCHHLRQLKQLSSMQIEKLALQTRCLCFDGSCTWPAIKVKSYQCIQLMVFIDLILLCCTCTIVPLSVNPFWNTAPFHKLFHKTASYIRLVCNSCQTPPLIMYPPPPRERHTGFVLSDHLSVHQFFRPSVCLSTPLLARFHE